MRRSLLLIFIGLLLVQSGCIRERTSGDTLVIHWKWWTFLWTIVVPITVGVIMFAKHPSMWVNGKWQPWWKFRGWDAREMGFALGFLVLLPLMGIYYQFDRLEVAPDHILESSLSPFRGTRRIAFSEIERIELPPPSPNGFLGSFRKRGEKSPPAMRIFLKGGRREDFNGFVRHSRSLILERARQAGATIVNAPPNQDNARPTARNDLPAPHPGDSPRQHSPSFDPFENAQPRFERLDSK